jgi:hypothetical protein
MKKILVISVLASTAMLGGLYGCASSSDKESDTNQSVSQTSATNTETNQPAAKPKKDKRPIEERLTVGMTMDQVKTACGNPKNVSMNSDGSQMWMYNNSQNVFIPNYTLFGGKIHYVTVYFDTTGKVKSWNSSSTGAY